MNDVELFFSISIDRTDLCRIFRLGTEPQLGTISLKLVFQFLNGRQPFFVDFIHGNRHDVYFCGIVGFVRRTDSLEAGG